MNYFCASILLRSASCLSVELGLYCGNQERLVIVTWHSIRQIHKQKKTLLDRVFLHQRQDSFLFQVPEANRLSTPCILLLRVLVSVGWVRGWGPGLDLTAGAAYLWSQRDSFLILLVPVHKFWDSRPLRQSFSLLQKSL